MNRVKLLSNGEINHKIRKNKKLGYLTHSLNFAHSDLSGFNVCPMAQRLSSSRAAQNKKLSSCSSVCVGANGFASIHPSVLESRINKTIAFKLDTKNFMLKLVSEIENAIKLAKKKNLKPTFRLNTYSDVLWENVSIDGSKNNIFSLFPNVTFYDYSKINNRKTPKNYQITYSHYGDFEKTSDALKNGFNSSIVFEKLPSKIKINNKIYSVIDGDKTDLRIDEKINGSSVVVGLKFKGSKAKLNDAIIDGFCLSKNNKSLIWEG